MLIGQCVKNAAKPESWFSLAHEHQCIPPDLVDVLLCHVPDTTTILLHL